VVNIEGSAVAINVTVTVVVGWSEATVAAGVGAKIEAVVVP